MFSISGLARRSDLPRRTIQYWADKEVIVPLPQPAGSDALKSYNKTELEIVRMLRPFAKMNATLGLLVTAATVFRTLLDDAEAPAEPDRLEKNVRDAIRTARKGKPVFLAVQVVETPGSPTGNIMTVWAARNEGDISKIVAERVRHQPALPMIILNLTDALNIQPEAAKWADE